MVAPLALLGLNMAADAVGGLADALGVGKAGSDPKAKLKKTADEFETVFLEHMFDRLTENGGQEGPLGQNGTGGDVYRSMLAKEYAGQVVKTGGIGLSGPVYRQLLQLQEGSGRGGA